MSANALASRKPRDVRRLPPRASCARSVRHSGLQLPEHWEVQEVSFNWVQFDGNGNSPTWGSNRLRFLDSIPHSRIPLLHSGRAPPRTARPWDQVLRAQALTASLQYPLHLPPPGGPPNAGSPQASELFTLRPIPQFPSLPRESRPLAISWDLRGSPEGRPGASALSWALLCPLGWAGRDGHITKPRFCSSRALKLFTSFQAALCKPIQGGQGKGSQGGKQTQRPGTKGAG